MKVSHPASRRHRKASDFFLRHKKVGHETLPEMSGLGEASFVLPCYQERCLREVSFPSQGTTLPRRNGFLAGTIKKKKKQIKHRNKVEAFLPPCKGLQKVPSSIPAQPNHFMHHQPCFAYYFSSAYLAQAQLSLC